VSAPKVMPQLQSVIILVEYAQTYFDRSQGANMRLIVDLFMTLLLMGSTICLSFADKIGILPVYSSSRFVPIRPNDLLIAHLMYKITIFGITGALLYLAFTEGIFAALLCVVFVMLILLFTSFLIRLILEVLLVLRTRE